jgi:hypothetical protein
VIQIEDVLKSREGVRQETRQSIESCNMRRLYKEASVCLSYEVLETNQTSKLTGLRESSSKGTAKEFVQSTTPFETMPSKMPTTRFRVPRATRW